MKDVFKIRGDLHGTRMFYESTSPLLSLIASDHFSWRNRSVLLYLSSGMNDEEIRRIIGNVTCVLIFHDVLGLTYITPLRTVDLCRRLTLMLSHLTQLRLT